jgi:hypothetical protein
MKDPQYTGNESASKKTLTGREATSWLSGASSITQLAAAAAWVSGEIDIVDLTPTQKAKALGLKPKEVRALAALPPEARATLITRRRVNGAVNLPDRTLDDLVERIGVVRVLASVDRHTTPKPNGGNGHHVTA